MPHLLIRGIPAEQIRAVSAPLVSELADICQCPEDYFLLECFPTTAVSQGEIVPSYPFIDVAWFDRGPAVRDRFAEAVDRHIRGLGLPELEIAFRVYREDHYYTNGQCLGDRGDEDDKAALQKELQKLKESNARLREQLRKTAGKPIAGADSAMSSRLREALRE
ncbi:DUF1904 family protein [Cohnella sp. CFH 77786]|uniref:DUF1904 family protein n=1 Tax=Cohnella sp. CFH 77786 TaxID=2662265 RepID=UPI001C60BEC0|nr:DUF1904 family protein [Cohnella sp. CFH 77786]